VAAQSLIKSTLFAGAKSIARLAPLAQLVRAQSLLLVIMVYDRLAQQAVKQPFHNEAAPKPMDLLVAYCFWPVA